MGRLPQHGRPGGPQQAQALQQQRERHGLAQIRPDRFLRRRRQGSSLHRRLARMGRQALRLRQLPAQRPLRQLALQRPPALQARQRRIRLPLRHLPGPPLARHRERDVRHDRTGDDPLAQVRLRRAEPERVDQGRLLRPQRRRQVLLLEVPDQPRRVRNRRRSGERAQIDPARSDHRRRHQRLDAAAGDLPRLRNAGAELVPGGGRSGSLRERQPLGDRSADLRHALPGQPQHASARRRPPRPGEPSTRAATPSSGRTRSPRRRSGSAGTGSGADCTAASPTPPSTSSGSRRSACSRRTTPSSPPPTPGSASASACSAT